MARPSGSKKRRNELIKDLPAAVFVHFGWQKKALQTGNHTEAGPVQTAQVYRFRLPIDAARQSARRVQLQFGDLHLIIVRSSAGAWVA